MRFEDVLRVGVSFKRSQRWFCWVFKVTDKWFARVFFCVEILSFQ